MNFRYVLIISGLLVVLFVTLYSWNRRTGTLDAVTTNIGLEVTGIVLNPVRQAQDFVTGLWDNYIDLVHVREQNLQLVAKLQELEAQVLAQSEDMAELRRLRELLKMPLDVAWRPLGARILAGRLGPGSQIESFTLNRGYTSGATPGTPVVTNRGLLGRVLRAAPHSSSAILLTHPTSRIAVFTQKSRTQGILTGNGPGRPMEVRYVDRATRAEPGELLVTSGLDGKYPKGIPAARILSVEPSNYNEFMTIHAEPLADLNHTEEVLLLEPTGVAPPPDAEEDKDPEGAPLPAFLKAWAHGQEARSN